MMEQIRDANNSAYYRRYVVPNGPSMFSLEMAYEKIAELVEHINMMEAAILTMQREVKELTKEKEALKKLQS